MADLLPFKVANAEGDVIFTKEGGMMAVIEYFPDDIEMISGLEHEDLIARIYEEIRVLFGKNPSWSIYSYACRKNMMNYITAAPDNFSSLHAPYWVDTERKVKFNDKNAAFTTKFYLAFKFSSDNTAALSGGILGYLEDRKRDNDQTTQEKERLNFNQNISNLVSGLNKIIPRGIKRLQGSDLMSFLRYSFNPIELFDLEYETSGQPILFLDAWLADCAFDADSQYPKIIYQGKTYHLGLASVRNYPNSISADFCGLINHFNFPCRFSTRFVGQSTTATRGFLAQRRTLLAGAAIKRMASAADKITGNLDDPEKVKMLHDSNAAGEVLEAGEVFGNLNTQFMVWDEDPDELSEKLIHIEETARGFGYACQRETFNASVAYLGSLPGEDDANLRFDLCTLHNAVYSYPWSTNWAGYERNMVVEGGGPPLMYGLSSGNTPLMISTHNSDSDTPGSDLAGHTMVIGQTGGGKSVLLVFMALQFAKYGGRVIYFDKKRSCMAATLGSDGQFFDFGDYQNPDNIGIQPLRDLDSEDDVAAAYLWIRELLQDKRGKDLETDSQQDIINVLELMRYGMPPEHRTLAVFKSLIQYPEIKKSLEDYVSGPYAGLFDKKKSSKYQFVVDNI